MLWLITTYPFNFHRIQLLLICASHPLSRGQDVTTGLQILHKANWIMTLLHLMWDVSVYSFGTGLGWGFLLCLCGSSTHCYPSQHLLPTVPMLAPLIDGMITRNISRRFTAAQALHFFEDLYSQTTQEQLNFNPGSPCPDMAFDDIRVDRWRNLQDDFVQTWSHLRDPPVPMSTIILHCICKNVWCYDTVLWARHLFKSIRTLIRYVSGWFGSLKWISRYADLKHAHLLGLIPLVSSIWNIQGHQRNQMI